MHQKKGGTNYLFKIHKIFYRNHLIQKKNNIFHKSEISTLKRDIKKNRYKNI